MTRATEARCRGVRGWREVLSTWEAFIRGLESGQNLDTQRGTRRRGTVWSIARGVGTWEDGVSVGCSKGWVERILCTEMDPSPVVETVVSCECPWENGQKARRPGCSQPLGSLSPPPLPFPAPTAKLSMASCPIPGAVVQSWWPSGPRRKSLPGRLLQGPRVTASQVSADQGHWKEEGRGLGCLNSWGRSRAATPGRPPSTSFLTQVPSNWGLAGTVH